MPPCKEKKNHIHTNVLVFKKHLLIQQIKNMSFHNPLYLKKKKVTSDIALQDIFAY